MCLMLTKRFLLFTEQAGQLARIVLPVVARRQLISIYHARN